MRYRERLGELLRGEYEDTAMLLKEEGVSYRIAHRFISAMASIDAITIGLTPNKNLAKSVMTSVCIRLARFAPHITNSAMVAEDQIFRSEFLPCN